MFNAVILKYRDPPYFADAELNQKNYQMSIYQFIFETKSYLGVAYTFKTQILIKLEKTAQYIGMWHPASNARLDPTFSVLVVRTSVAVKVYILQCSNQSDWFYE